MSSSVSVAPDSRRRNAVALSSTSPFFERWTLPVTETTLGSPRIQSDWSELDTVVDYIRTLRGVDKVALVAWSQGSFRAGPYAVQHPEKVESLFLLAPVFNPNFRSGTGPMPLPIRVAFSSDTSMR